MLAGVFGIFLGATFGNDSFLDGRLVLDKLDIRHLSPWRRWNQKEKGKNEAGDDK